MTVENNPQSTQQRQHKPIKVRGWLQFILVAVFVVGSYIFAEWLKSIKDEPHLKQVEKFKPIVNIIEASASSFPIEWEATGVVQARNEIQIVPQVSGRIEWLNPNFVEGKFFDKGVVLFRIEQKDYLLRIEKAKAAIKQAETTIALEQANANAAIVEWKIINENKAVPDLVSRKPQIAQAQAALKSANADLSEAKININRTNYTLPFSGYVTETRIETGQFVSQGQPYGMVYTNNSLEISVPIEENKIQWIEAEKTPVEITVNDKNYAGYVSRIQSTLDKESRYQTVFIRTKEQNVLIPGNFVKVKFEGRNIENLWKLPLTSLQDREFIWIVQDDMTVKKYPVTILTTTKKSFLTQASPESLNVKVVNNMVEGLSDGMEVIINLSNP